MVRYQSADVSDTGQTFQDNTAVMKALVAKYPEFRDAFAGIVVRAVEPSGQGLRIDAADERHQVSSRLELLLAAFEIYSVIRP